MKTILVFAQFSLRSGEHVLEKKSKNNGVATEMLSAWGPALQIYATIIPQTVTRASRLWTMSAEMPMAVT